MVDILGDTAVQQALSRSILLAGLVVARLMPVVMLAPFLGGKAAPAQVKLGLALTLTVLVYPAVWNAPGAVGALGAGPLVITGLVFKELAVGATLGFIAALVFDAARMAGRLIDTTRGASQSMSMVPELKTQVTTSANLLVQFFIVMFFLTGGHRVFLRAVVLSFERIPPHTFPDLSGRGSALAFSMARFVADAIELAVLLAFPVIAALLLTNVFLALVNKAAPQINVFFLGMPLKAMIGVIVVLLALGPLTTRFLTSAQEAYGRTLELTESVAPEAP